jgi:hypothetical protein
MAVYWVDPYIDTTKGGIHGTTSTTTRDGAYATPFGLAEMFGANTISTMNGTSLVSGDEIRLKGQALVDFYFNIGTTGNTIDITNADLYGLDFASTDEQYVATYKTALAATGDTVPALIIHDAGLLGTNKFMLHHSRNTFANFTNEIAFRNHPYNALFAWLLAKTGIDVNDNVKVAFVDPVYVFDYNAVFSGANPDNAFHFGVNGITVTDGWLSSSARGGFTMLPIKAGGSHNLACTWWNENSGFNQTFDMPSTFINWYHPTADFIPSLKQYQRLYGMTEGSFRLGQWGHNTSSAWNYCTIYSTTTNTNANDNPCIEYGNYINSYYLQINGTGATAIADRAVLKISNMIMGQGPYLSANRYRMAIGNFISYQPYSGGTILYNNQPDGEVSFLENSHLYGYQNQAGVFRTIPIRGITIPASVTNFQSNNAHYPGTVNVTSGGPVYSSATLPSEHMIDNVTASLIGIAPASWSNVFALNMHGSQTVLSTYRYGQWNNTMGILDCGSTDYKTTNANILLVNQGYTNTSRFAGVNMHFAGNTFDGAPLALWGHQTTITNSPFSSLLSYNNAAGDIVVMMSSFANENKNHIKSFVFQLPDLSTATNLAVSYTITRSSSALTAVPSSKAFLIESNTLGIDSYAGFSSAISNNVYTMSVSTSDFDSNARFMGISIVLSSGSGLSVTDTFTISAPTFTVT